MIKNKTRNLRSHGAQYKISIPKFDFKQAAIEEKMVDEVLQGDYDNADSIMNRKKQNNLNNNNNRIKTNQILKPLIAKQQQYQQNMLEEDSKISSQQRWQQQSMQKDEEEMEQIDQQTQEWVKNRLEQQQKMMEEKQKQENDEKVYGYQENDILEPLGDDKFLYECLESNKNLIKYDCFDEEVSGKEWVNKYRNDNRSHGKSPMYFNNQYQWVNIQVIDFNESTAKFKIKTLSGGIIKEVNRLSILFRDEDIDKFRSRLKICKMRQNKADDDLRFEKHVDSLDNNQVSSLSIQTKKVILQKALKRKKLDNMNIIIQDLVADIVVQIEREYQSFMKKVIVIREMQDNNNDQKFQKLRLQVRRKQNVVPMIGTISIQTDKNFNFKEMKENVGKSHISKYKQVVDAMNMFTNKSYNFENFNIFKTNLNKHQLPMDMSSFEKQQQNHFITAKQQLQYQWREYLITEINRRLDNKNIFWFYEIDINKYQQSELCRLLKRYDLMMNTYVRNFIVTNNINDWCNFIKKFTIPDSQYGQNWLINDYPLMIINLEVNTKLQDKIKFQKKKKSKKLEDQNKQMQEQALYEGVPDDLIYLEPNYNKLLECLQRPFLNLIQATNSFNNMEKDSLTMLDVPEKQIYPINEDNDEIKKGMETIKQYLDKGYEEAENILIQFQKYQFLFERTEKILIKNIFGVPKDVIIEDLDKDLLAQSLVEIQQAKVEISKLCIDQYIGRFFKVNTQKAKQSLIQKAEEQQKIIFQTLSEITFNNIELIGKTYEDMIAKVTVMPTDEQQLIALRNFISENDLNLARLNKKVIKVSQFIDIMDNYCYQFNEKYLESFWLLKSMPYEIKIAVNEGQKKVTIQDAKFREKLKNEQEVFSKELMNIIQEVESIKKYNDYTKVKECAEKVTNIKEKLDKAQVSVQSFNERERLFKLDVSDYDDLSVTINVFEPFYRMWDLVQEIDLEKYQWMGGPFLKLNYADIEKKVNNSYMECSKLIKQFEELEEVSASQITRDLKDDIQAFKQQMWVIEFLTTDAMIKKPIYWREVFNQCNIKTIETVSDEMTFRKLIENKILDYRSTIEELSRKAEKQWGMEKKLMEIIEKLKELKLDIFPYKGTYILKGMDEVQQTIDDYLNIIGMMKQSPFIKPVQKECNKCDQRLQLMQDTLDGWIKCQRNWMYLQPIFASDDIKKKMPEQKYKFDSVNDSWKSTMEQFNKDQGMGLYEHMETDKLKNEFDLNNKNLDQIQKRLSEYMEQKRRAFARFFFLSDDQLLEILADTKDPTTVQKHINKCFEAIKYIEFKPNNIDVIAMISPEDEIVKFTSAVNVEEGEKKGNVELWLLEIEDQMRKSLRDIVKKSLVAYQKTERTDWVLQWQAQIIIAVDMIQWTFQTEEAIQNMKKDSKSLRNHFEFLDDQLQQIVKLVRGDLKELDRLTLGAMVTLDVHAKEIIEPLIKEGVNSTQDFKWTSQLRYYYDEPTKGPLKDQIVIKVQIVNATQYYGYEYLGNSTRLVVTPLTDRCYTTLMGAYHLNYGGAPEGPAGTGKTETTKDLAKAVAMYCVVFNCSDGLNYQAMSKFFKGLCSSGSWCCFDEFNRINVEVLSVIAQQIIQIQTAIKAKVKTFTFDEEEGITIISTCTVNITMNPGYAGRASLPDNLKALFRPCAMMVPNYELISKIYLYSVGFQTAEKLATKIVASLRLSSELLSSQYHYDFGMRAVKSILVASGGFKRTMPDDNEDIVTLTALKAVNLPKFTINDIPLFLSIMKDLFPGIEMPNSDYVDLKKALIQACEDQQLQANFNFLNKCIELYDTIIVRHGLMLVGETYSGKSKVITTLKKALNILSKEGKGAPAKTFELNPKSIQSFQLYGKFDPDTKSWTDGILPIIMRVCVSDDKNPEKKWVVFDGPVDAIWIENMNTVLDDNKKLCLTSGEVIKLSNQMTMMFEVEDLIYASPATVSRCGMVYLEAIQLGWIPIISSFVISPKFPPILESYRPIFEKHTRYFLDPAITFAKATCTFPMVISWNSTVETFLENMSTFLEPYLEENAKVPKDYEDLLINQIVFSLVWSVGCIIEERGRPKFNKFLQELIGGEDVVNKYQLLLQYEESEEELKWKGKEWNVKIKDVKNIYEMYYNGKSNNWLHWLQTMPNYVIPKECSYNELLIPTSDSIRMNYFLHLNVSRMRHVLFTGPTGVGKTANVIKELNDFYYNPTCTNLITAFSGQTSANQIQKTIESKMTKKRKGVLCPEERKNMLVIFIDDLNMPIKEAEGQAQPSIEILRQWQDYQGWYDLEEKEYRKLEDIVFVGAMGPPSQGRNSITPRYSRHYNIIYVESFEAESLTKIFENIMEWFFLNQNGNLAKSVVNQKEKIVASTVELYNKVKSTFLPTPSKQHYVYNMRDVSKVFQGIAKSTFKSLRSDDEFIRLWSHECMRIFQDRLVNKEDQDLFEVEIKKIIKANFNKDWKDLVKQEPLLWASYVPSIYPDNDKSKRPLQEVYCELNDLENVKKITYEKLEEYNNFNVSKRMNLVLFMNAIQHVIRIVRIITTTFGHALLVGVGGSGRKSLAILSCFVAQYDLIQVDAKNWIEELQRVLKIAGMEMKNCIFLFSDSQVSKESQLEDICNILNNGEVPNLFLTEDRNKIIEEMAQYTQGTINQKWAYFVKKCKENLHMVLCMSPEGEAFRKRILTFPGLVNCTTIDWFLPWPEEALRSTAASAIGKISQIPQEQKDGVVDVCADMQNRIFAMSARMIVELKRYFFVTPTSYLELLSTISKLIQERSEAIFSIIAKYQNGLEKLAETEKEVDKKQKDLQELQPQLVVASKKNAEMLVTLTVQQKDADAKRTMCEKDEAETMLILNDVTVMRENCQKDLDKVIPLLDEATKALEKLSKSDIDTIKSFKQPPANIAIVMQGIIIALNQDKQVTMIPKEKGSLEKVKDYWGYSTKNILNGQLLKTLQGYDTNKILLMPAENIKQLKELLTNPLVEPNALKQASTNGYNLCFWIRAIVESYEALLVVEPKKRDLAIAQEKLEKAEKLLAEKKAALAEVLATLQKLQDEYDTAKREKDQLEAKVQKCETELKNAQQLISGLGGEKENWTKKSIQCKEESKNIVGDVVLSSGIIAYLGAFPINYRKEAIAKWYELLQKNNILVSQDYSLQNVMTDLITIGKWVNNDKLPNDDFSIDNSIILKNSRRWPLMIDPQLQANIWVRQMEKDQLQIIRPGENQMQFKIDNARNFEKVLLLENVGETIDQIFDQILNNIDKKSQFRFYMTTKLANPKYTPETCVQVTLLNFMATQQGLEDQLLGTLVRMEEQKLYVKREKDIKEFFEFKSRQKQNEDTILKMLYESSGNILENVELIETLQKSQVVSKEIEIKLLSQEENKVKYLNTRNQYKNAAIRGSHLYFVISNLADVEPVYQFSLESYMKLFEKGIEKAEKSEVKSNKEQRVNNIIEKFTIMLYEHVVRSLLEKDKLLFSFLMTTKLMQEERKLITSNEVRFLAVGGTALSSEIEKPEGEWTTDRQWAVICQVADSFDIFKQLPKHMLQNPNEWKQLLESNNVHIEEEVEWPKDYKNLNRFQKLIIIRILRPEKTIPAIQQLVIKELGEKFVEIPPFDLDQTFDDSNCMTPLIFVLSSGADPRSELEVVAQKKGMQNNLITMSLGQGQGEIAEKRINEGWASGKWILLQNCHLAPSWMGKLESMYENTPADCHPNFRLWLTTVPSPVFPVSVLQNGLKITYEPPKGLKNNLQRCYLQVDKKKFEGSSKPFEWKKLLFGLSFFHALVLERRKFGPLGWNIPYEFAATDLEISVSQLYMFLEEYDEIPWTALNYMVAEANYGGRVTDDRDRRLISIVLQDFYSPKILMDSYKFSPTGVYYAPEEGSIDSYIEFIKQLPLNDMPEAFGMHPNAEISGAIFDTNNLCSTIISILPKESGGGGVSLEDVVKEKCRNWLRQLPQLFDVEQACRLRPVLFEESMNTVLQQEILRYNRLLKVVRTSLANVIKAIDGEVSMNNDLNEVFIKVVNNKIPQLWIKYSYPSLKPLASYIIDFIDRLTFIDKWINNGSPSSFWISGFYFTQSFLTGTLQNYARKYKIAIDSLIFDFKIVSENDTSVNLNKAPEDGNYIYGLFLDGARWDNDTNTMNEQNPKQLYCYMPHIQLIPIVKDQLNEKEEKYYCPVYKTSERQGTLSTTGHSTNYVMYVHLPILPIHNSAHWVKRGVAMLTQLND